MLEFRQRAAQMRLSLHHGALRLDMVGLGTQAGGEIDLAQPVRALQQGARIGRQERTPLGSS
jgi:hypothetical protein